MAKWILWIGILLAGFSCRTEIRTDNNREIADKTESGTVDVLERDNAAVPLIFLLKELKIKGSNQLSIRDTALFTSLPAGVYEVKTDTILFGKSPTEWISSGITRWPPTGRIALADFIISDQPLFCDKVGIFPQQPGEDGYLPGCFGCPGWMAGQYGALLVFWEQCVSGRGRPN